MTPPRNPLTPHKPPPPSVAKQAGAQALQRAAMTSSAGGCSSWLTGKQGIAVLDMACVQAQVRGLQPEDELHLVQLVQLLTDDVAQLAQCQATQLEEEGRVKVPQDSKPPG